jgi:MFS family permease
VRLSNEAFGVPGRLPRMPAAFAVAACSLILVFATAGAPIPLYNLYRAQDGITNANLGHIAVGYFVAAAVSLLWLGRLSDHLGRRPVGMMALGSAILSCLVLAFMQGPTSLLVARVLQGLAAGLASSSLGAYVVDTAPPRPRWLAALVAGSAPMVGVPIGALASGALAEYGPAPRTLVYEAIAAALLACAAFMVASPETVRRNGGAMQSLRPQLELPPGRGRLLFTAGAVFVATWSIGGFYQAFAPSVVAESLGVSNALVTAAAFSSVMVLAPFGGPLAARVSAIGAVRLGMGLLMLALAAIVASLHVGAILLFLGATLLVGFAQGIASTGGLRALLAGVEPGQRAGLLSTIYLISYCGAAVPALVAGRFAATQSLFHIAIGYAVLGFVAAVIAIASMKGR